ncbi:MAG: hypothetical protein C0511_15530 [Hyphomicrobium sp.]|nr:hypothetical protein [Hyphomicrobium sp.]
MTRALTEPDKRAGFLRATANMSGGNRRWAERAARGLTDPELTAALAYELGIFGGSCGPGMPALTYQGSGLKIWISWEVHSHVTMKPTFEGKATIAMARISYGIIDPSDIQRTLF